MKLYNIFFLMNEEWKVNIKYIVFAFLLLTAIFSVALLAISMSISVPKMIYNRADKVFSKKDIRISFNNIKYASVSEILKKDVYNLHMEYDAENIIMKNAVLTAGSGSVSVNKKGRVVLFQDNNYILENNLKEGFILEGEKWNFKDNEKNKDGIYYIWLNEKISKDLGVRIGDEVIFSSENINKPFSFFVKGIFLDDDILSDFLLPFKSGEEMLKTTEYNTRCSGALTLKEFYQYLQIKKELESMGIYVYPIKQLEELLFSKNLIQGVFYVISVLLILAGIGIMCNILQMIIQSRIKLIGILRAMGMSINSISFMYMFMFEVVVILSVLSGSIIGYMFNNYSSNLLTALFPEDISGYMYEAKSMLIALILSNILL
ncbi:MAG TPA: hypothetical protein GX727_05490, partial [Clostridium sp.]|nr:hypothetical protein [Clostridium sp.]